MPQHQERTANALARGPAKADDIERARNNATATEPNAVRVQRKLDEVEATTASLRAELETVLPAGDRGRPSRSESD
jgi:hypothetical protein